MDSKQNNEQKKELESLKVMFDNPVEGTKYTVIAIVEKVFRRDDGFNLFTIFDGLEYFKMAIFIPKTAAFPEVVRGSVVRFTFKIKYYEGNLEGTPLEAEVLTGKEHAAFMKTFRSRVTSKFAPDRSSLIMESDAFKRLESRFRETASLIRQAVYEKRPVLMTHHADCDGYAAGFILENAISQLFNDAHPHERMIDRLLTRIPSRSPYYDIIDATRDIGFFRTSEKRHGDKPPLVLIVDNGSTEQDLLSIQKVKMFGADVAVVDHHDPGHIDSEGQSLICREVLEHVNPHLEGLSIHYSASLLAYVLAPFVRDHEPSLSAAIVGAVADRSDVPELKDMIDRSGQSREFFERLALYVDYEIHLTRGNLSNSVLEELITGPYTTQRNIMSLYEDSFNEQEAEVKEAVKTYSVVETTGRYDVCLVNGETVSFKGDYYSPGKLAGIAHDSVHDKNSSNAVTIVYTDSIFVFRVAQQQAFFDVNALIKHLRHTFPAARINGGGHAVAGTVKTLPVSFNEVFAEIKRFIGNL